MISHCIPAAGIAGLIKTALALHHRMLPPTLCESVNPELGIAATPFYVNTEAGAVDRAPRQRRAAPASTRSASAASTSHAIVEEAPAEAKRPERCTPWPAELVVLSAATPEALLDEARARSPPRSAGTRHAAGRRSPPRWRAPTAASRSGSPSWPRTRSRSPRASSRRVTRLRDKPAPRWSLRSGAFYASAPDAGKLAFLFPGEGSQYTGHARRPRPVLRRGAAVARLLALALRPAARRQPHRHRLPARQRDRRRRAASSLDARLHDMDVGSEAVFVAGMAMQRCCARSASSPT